MLIKNSIDYELIEDQRHELELICIKIQTMSTSIVLASYYNRPHNPKDENTLKNDLFKHLENRYKRVILCGDLNACTKKFGSKNVSNINGNILEEIVTNTSFMVANINNIPTYHKLSANRSNEYHEVLDYALYTKQIKNNIIETEVLDNVLLGSDHSAISIKLDFNLRQKSKPQKQEVYLYTKTNWATFKESLKNSLSIDNINDVNEAADVITAQIEDAIAKSVPKVSIRDQTQIQFPEHIRQLIRQKNKIIKQKS